MIVVILTINIIAGFFIINPMEIRQGYTGFEKISEAYDLINNETNLIEFVGLGCSDLCGDGIFKKVRCSFRDIRYTNEIDGYYYNYYSVTFIYGKEPVVKYNIPMGPPSRRLVNESEVEDIKINGPRIDVDDLIDSDEAYEIATKDPGVKKLIWEGKWEGNFKLFEYGFSYSTMRWFIRWTHNDPNDQWGESGIFVVINAETGEITTQI